MANFLSTDEYNQIAAMLGRHMSAEVLARRFLSSRFTDFKVGELRDIQRWLRTNKQPQNPFWSKPSQPKKEATINNIVRGIEHYKREQPEAAATTVPSTASYAAGYQHPNGHHFNPAAASSQYPANQAYGQPANQAISANGLPYINNYPQQPRLNGQPPAPYDRNNPGLNRTYPVMQPQYNFPNAPQNNESLMSELTNHPAFQRHRSPYEIVHMTLSKAWLGAAGNAFSARAYLQFTIPPAYLARLKRGKSTMGDMWIQLRLFSQAALDHVMLGAGSRVRVNAHDIPIPDIKKLSKAKKKGLELSRPLNITDHLTGNNYVEIELIRQQITGPELFRGLVTVELCSERSTQDLINQVKKTAEAQVPVQSIESMAPISYKPNPKQCSVCQSTKDLLRCSRCKNEWYCGEQHQREHWVIHRSQCQPPNEQQQREQQAYEQLRDTVVLAVQPLARARNGRILLTMPTRVKPEVEVSSHLGGGDDLDDEIAEVDTKVSLKDPVSLERLEIAAKGRSCAHLPCFDVATFLQFSQQSGVWQCPICYAPVSFEDLVVDREMNAVLAETDSECAQIRVQPNGEWEPINEEEKRATKKQKTANLPVVDILDEDDSHQPNPIANQSANGSLPSSPYARSSNQPANGYQAASTPAWSHYDPNHQPADQSVNQAGFNFLADAAADDGATGATLEDAIELD